MTLKERGISLCPWQEHAVNCYKNGTLHLSFEVYSAVRQRASGKTFLSYVMNMLEAEGKDEYVVNYKYDIDNTTHERIHYWFIGFIEFIKKYYPDYRWTYYRHIKTLIVSKPKSKISKLLGLLRKGEL